MTPRSRWRSRRRAAILPGVDPFAVVILGGIALLVLFCLAVGKLFPGSGADVLDWKPTQTYERRLLAEVEDLDQMLEATNARRRRRGEDELTEDALHERVRADMTEAQKRREAYLADQEIDQLVAARNERRRRRGQPQMTRAEVEAEIARMRADAAGGDGTYRSSDNRRARPSFRTTS